MAQICKGGFQSGLWGCFDEFTRISSATLTFVAAKDEKPLRSSLLLTQAKKQDARQKIHTTKRIYRVFQTDKQGSKRKHEFSVLLEKDEMKESRVADVGDVLLRHQGSEEESVAGNVSQTQKTASIWTPSSKA